ncbi:MAG: kinase [Candidatus Methanomethylophilaceae archaeon]|nr:kinase [Candidatus Methanomethylophilaceae archaeon]
MSKIIRARAPLRIGIAGGGTDVEPYASEHGGLVFNTTIDKYAYCTLIPNETDEMTVVSPNYGTVTEKLELPMRYDGTAEDLVRSVVNHFQITQGFKVYVRSDVPPGSGLGGSSTLMVAIIKAFSEWKKIKMSKHEIASLAFHLEREDIGLGGGKQDQYAAAFGGFNMMYFTKDGVDVRPVRLKDSVLQELQERSLLCYTGRSRESATIIEEQVKDLKNDISKEEAYEESKRLAMSISRALRLKDIDGAAALLNLAWEQKKKFTSKISNPRINELYKTAMDNGALGGKVSGAGGGGFMFFICAPGKRERVCKRLEAKGAEVLQFKFDDRGARTGKLDVGEYTARLINRIWATAPLPAKSN